MYTVGGVIQCWRDWYGMQRDNVLPRTKRLTVAGALLGTAFLLGASVCLWQVFP